MKFINALKILYNETNKTDKIIEERKKETEELILQTKTFLADFCKKMYENKVNSFSQTIYESEVFNREGEVISFEKLSFRNNGNDGVNCYLQKVDSGYYSKPKDTEKMIITSSIREEEIIKIKSIPRSLWIKIANTLSLLVKEYKELEKEKLKETKKALKNSLKANKKGIK